MSIIAVSSLDGSTVSSFSSDNVLNIFNNTFPSSSTTLSYAATNGSRIIIVRDTSVNISDDGGWTFTTYSDAYQRLTLFWNGSNFVSFDTITKTYLYSPTGNSGTWVSNTISTYTSDSDTTSIAWYVDAGTTFVTWGTATGIKSTRTINNGETWTTPLYTTSYGHLRFERDSFIKSGSYYYIIGYDDTQFYKSYLLTSTDGVNWYTSSAGAPFNVDLNTGWYPKTICASGSNMITMGSTHTLQNTAIYYYSSDNGITWTYAYLGGILDTTWRLQTYAGLFYLSSVYTNGTQITSDMINWTSQFGVPIYGNGIVRSPINILRRNAAATSTSTLIKKVIRFKNFLVTVVSSANSLSSRVKLLTQSVLSNSNSYIQKFTKMSRKALVTSIPTSFIGRLYFRALNAVSTSISTFFGYDTTFRRTLNAVSTSISNISFNQHWANIWSMLYKTSQWIGVKVGTAIGVTSPDGTTWTTQTLPSSQNWVALANNGTINATIAKGTAIAASSPDGITWTQQALPATRLWSSLTAKTGLFVAVALQTDKSAISADGITWTEQSLPASANWTSVTTNGTIFVAVSDNGIAATSLDGITWTQYAMPDQLHFNCVTWALNQFTAVASGPTNLAASSPDGITWTRVYMPSSQNWTGVGPGVGNPNV